MQRKSVSTILMAAIPIVMIVCFMLAGASAMAQSDMAPSANRPCSNRSLLGDYGFVVEGLLLPAPGVALPGRGVTMTHFDGEGNLTQVDSFIINGSPLSDARPVTAPDHV